MPTHASDPPASPHQIDLGQTGVACPAPLTPPLEGHGNHQTGHGFAQQRSMGGDGVSRQSMSDNTATGMSLLQEESLYNPPESFQGDPPTEPSAELKEGDVLLDEGVAKVNGVSQTETYETACMIDLAEANPKGPVSSKTSAARDMQTIMKDSDLGTLSPPSEVRTEDRKRGFSGTPGQAGIPSIDQELDWSSEEKEWDCSRRRLRPQYPSATFQPYAKFKGTQQSDRQVYNVEVTILTVDIEQASMSGYLQICGLTPDHPTLTTFFTGEIIGGPNQKYSFRTRDPAWGASDKTDLIHWARFPAWRPLSPHAKRNINFVYPLNHEDWWQQEHIFMRWKEHFLVPDYKLKSIQGASFEGFYYICFNQVEGRVSGIYFHSKSEK
ncbi:hypothetical protein A1O1_08193 [Capronia coronata CBS 617.96]|uniref:Vesicle-mediated transporter Vid24 n=1 Tax=Capronia coronata CBS 617.96 TaxID=1182541 RepID=W9YIJ3_9EURO|nr:uncharacterized protein A1O1_08193 [Capronia coronata CBS 617.96]EXJ82124.1 hypothetical protein A1O1_08193 [Capronia coronata CBS 617.96]